MLKMLGLLAAWAAVAALAGCQPQRLAVGEQGRLAPPVPQVRLGDLAGQLGLAVAHAGRTSATLRNAANTVVLYAEPEGEVYVNGVPIPDSGGVAAAGGTLLVPAALVSQISVRLRPANLAPEPLIRPTPRPHRHGPTAWAGCVVLDPGHGGQDPGAISCLGSYEKDIVLRVAKAVATELRRQNVDVRLTRTDDSFLELEERPAVASRCKADLFVSVHADWAKNRSASGFTAYVSRGADAGSLMAAETIVRRVSAAGIASRGLRRADFRVLVHADCPAVLVELGYLSNRWEAARLDSAAHQQRLADAIARGAVEFLKAK
jgi:N-acetylmuramoyl-L-alanine amidase